MCFEFKSPSWLRYSPSNVNARNSSHYTITFKTNNPDGTLFFAKGGHRDFERLFLSGGVLHYLLFNPASTGHGSSFGAHAAGYRMVNGQRRAITVDDGQWHTVKFFRNWDIHGGDTLYSGMIMDGQYELAESGFRRDVDISEPFYVGGMQNSENSIGFTGQIKDFVEKKNNFHFELNFDENEEVVQRPNC